jgi:hypothetical protein
MTPLAVRRSLFGFDSMSFFSALALSSQFLIWLKCLHVKQERGRLVFMPAALTLLGLFDTFIKRLPLARLSFSTQLTVSGWFRSTGLTHLCATTSPKRLADIGCT